MTSAVYLEHFLDSLEHLPKELQRNFNLMRDLDSRAQDVMRNIDKYADDFMGNFKSMSTEKKKDLIAEIQGLYNKAREYGDDKVQLAIQTYELVDKHIRRLDSDLQRFETEIQEKINRTIDEQNSLKGKRKKIKEKEKRKIASSDDEAGAKSKKRKKAVAAGSSGNVAGGKSVGGGSAGGASSGSVVPTDPEVLDMPVDPNEPTYCLCHQVSYGEMIGCDNLDCPIEWFHFACVKLTTKPKGKWYCPKCSVDRKKK